MYILTQDFAVDMYHQKYTCFYYYNIDHHLQRSLKHLLIQWINLKWILYGKSSEMNYVYLYKANDVIFLYALLYKDYMILVRLICNFIHFLLVCLISTFPEIPPISIVRAFSSIKGRSFLYSFISFIFDINNMVGKIVCWFNL